MCINHGGARHKAVSLSPAQCSGWPDADGTSTHMYVRDAGLTLFESLFVLGEGGFLRELRAPELWWRNSGERKSAVATEGLHAATLSRGGE